MCKLLKPFNHKSLCRVRSGSGSFMSGSGPKRSGSAKLVQQLYFNLDKLYTIAYLLGLSSWYCITHDYVIVHCTGYCMYTVQYVLVNLGLFYKTCPKKVYSCLSTILKDYIIINIYIYKEQSLYLPKHMFTVFCTQSLYSYTVIPLYTRARELNKYYCPIHTITIYMYIVYCMYK